MRDVARWSRGYGDANQNEGPLPLSSRNLATVARRPVTAGQQASPLIVFTAGEMVRHYSSQASNTTAFASRMREIAAVMVATSRGYDAAEPRR